MTSEKETDAKKKDLKTWPKEPGIGEEPAGRYCSIEPESPEARRKFFGKKKEKANQKE